METTAPPSPTPEQVAQQAKEIEFYAAGVTAWYNTRLEHDKSLLTLSAAGIGLLITLLTTVGVKSAEGLVLYLAAMLAFLLCSGIVLLIFRANSAYVEAMLRGGAQASHPRLRRLDNGAMIAFAAGVAFSAAIGVSAAINSYSTKAKMTNDSSQPSDKAVLHQSGGALGSAPTTDLQRSFNNAANLRPLGPSTSQSGADSTAAQATTSSTPPATAPTTTPPEPQAGSGK